MGDSNPKIKHDTFSNQYKNSGLKCDKPSMFMDREGW